jgi:hypothetical protein
VIHLWHPEADRGALGENEHRLAAAMSDKRVRARRGLSAITPVAS